jgi:hypothetical protein
MNALRDFFNHITSGDLPTGGMLGGGVVLFLIAVKARKAFLKLVFVVLALAALAGAVWWHFRKP